MSLAWSSVKALSIPVGGVSRDVKRVSIGGVEVWRKLPYDAEVEYIESTGTQWIDTGILPDDTTIMAANGLFPVTASATRFGARNTATDSVFTLLSIAAGFRASIGTGTDTVINRAFATKTNATSMYLDAPGRTSRLVFSGGGDETVSWPSIASFSANYPIYLFAFNGAGSAVVGGGARLSAAQITKSGVLVRDFQPVRVGSGANAVGCLYDKLGTGGMNPDGSARNDGLYFNRGTGAFVVGPDANA